MSRVDERNRAYSVLLGWTTAGLTGESAIGEAFAAKVRAVQRDAGLTADGIVGPKTYGAFLDAEYERRRPALAIADGDARLRLAGELALNRAKSIWLKGVVDPKDASKSESYQASRGWIDRFIKEGLEWTWQAPYVDDNDFAWCGAFASFAWKSVGLDPKWRKTFWASTLRLDCWGGYRDWNEVKNPKPAEGGRLVRVLNESSSPLQAEFDGPDDVALPRAGDILLVGVKAQGEHICLIESYDMASGFFTTIEGNATGKTAQGHTVEGVIRTRRPVGRPEGMSGHAYHARRLIRPALSDLSHI
jgi:hypothetical protein